MVARESKVTPLRLVDLSLQSAFFLFNYYNVLADPLFFISIFAAIHAKIKTKQQKMLHGSKCKQISMTFPERFNPLMA